MPRHYPGIIFDQAGRCSECGNYRQRLYTGIESLRSDINNILKKHPHRNYDCILGISGGRDSTYLLHILCVEKEMNRHYE